MLDALTAALQSQNGGRAMTGLQALGGALNARQVANNQIGLARARTQSLAQALANMRVAMERQQAVIDAERQRQFEFARGAGQAFAENLGMFQGNVEQQLDDRAGSIADLFVNAMTQAQMPQASVAAEGATADLEAAMREQARAETTGDATRAAQVRAFADLFGDKGRAMANNQTVAGILENFAAGSRGAAEQEARAAGMYFTPGAAFSPDTSLTGDMLSGLGGLGQIWRAMNPAAPDATMFSGYAEPSLGLKAPSGPSLGVNPGADSAPGLKLRSLGIR